LAPEWLKGEMTGLIIGADRQSDNPLTDESRPAGRSRLTSDLDYGTLMSPSRPKRIAIMSVMTPSRGCEMVSVPTLSEIRRADPRAFVEKYDDIAAINLACAAGLPGTDGLDIARCLRSLDAMAVVARQKTNHAWHIFERNPSEFENSKNVFSVLFMLYVLHREFGVHYNPARIDRSDETFDPLDTADLFIHGILSPRRTGTCASLPVFAVAVGRRLGYPLKLVKVPEHLLFRWDDGSERFNVDYNGEDGNIHHDAYYQTWPLKWTPQIWRAQTHARWLTSLTPQQEVECFLGHRFLTLHALKRWDEALECLLAAERYNQFCKPLHEGLRTELLENIARRDGLAPETARLAAAFLAGVDVRRLLKAGGF
jgi:Transglutaminase-like superfamily